MRLCLSVASGVLLLLACSCKREERGFRVNPPSAATIQKVSLVELFPGGTPAKVQVNNDYEENAYAVSEGKNLYSAFNCVGCHSHGGGGVGAPRFDEHILNLNKKQHQI
jgi:cytochrome c oxidase cbb3-type subunit 3